MVFDRLIGKLTEVILHLSEFVNIELELLCILGSNLLDLLVEIIDTLGDAVA